MWGFAGRSSEPFLKQASFNSSCRQVQEMSGGQVQEEEEHKGAGAYGTFQGPPSYPPPRPPPLGYPQPVRAAAPPAPGRVRGHDRLPCCGIGFGWFLFIVGFFLGAIPWYVGAILLCCSRVDHREKPGYVACTIAAVLATIAVIIGATAGAHVY